MKCSWYRLSRLLCVAWIVSAFTVTTAADLTVYVPPIAPGDQDFEGLDAEALKEVVEEALTSVGADGFWGVGLSLAQTDSTGQTPCDPTEVPEGFTLGKLMFLNLPNLVAQCGGKGLEDLSTPAGQAEIASTVLHEAGHNCYLASGGSCPSNKTEELCGEIAADAFAIGELCKLVDQLCEEYCDLLESADDPPTQEQADALDELAERRAAFCKEIQDLQDRYDDEAGAELACYCNSNNLPPPTSTSGSDCPGFSVPDATPPAGGGDGDFPEDCDFPEGPQDVMPKCTNCDTGCICIEVGPPEEEEF